MIEQFKLDAIRFARSMGWTPTSPTDWLRYLRALDYELPGDEAFLDALSREACLWLNDNISEAWG